MIILLDTSTPTCKLTLIDGEVRHDHAWEAARELAKGLLGFLQDHLQEHDKTWVDLTGLGVYQGPGSFTGLRIGITVMNTLADSLGIPIVGGTGENWQSDILQKLSSDIDEKLVMPEYGREAHITTPRK